VFDSDPHESRERNLWQEVLLRAVMDARLEPSSKVITGLQAHDVRAARDYLTNPTKDLAIICSRAGMDIDAVMEATKRQIGDAARLDTSPFHTGEATSKRGRKMLTYQQDGKELTINELADLIGVSPSTISRRMRKGQTIGDALSGIARARPKRTTPATGRKITFNGEALTVAGWSRKTGLSVGTINARLRTRWTIEAVLNPEKVPGKRSKF
jgi:hypothetical protein